MVKRNLFYTETKSQFSNYITSPRQIFYEEIYLMSFGSGDTEKIIPLIVDAVNEDKRNQ